MTDQWERLKDRAKGQKEYAVPSQGGPLVRQLLEQCITDSVVVYVWDGSGEPLVGRVIGWDGEALLLDLTGGVPALVFWRHIVAIGPLYSRTE